MTIPAAVPTYVQAPGNGISTVFTFPFKIFQATDLVVGFIVGGVYALQTSGFTVQGVDNNGGAQVTFTTAPPTGTTVDIRSLTPQVQNTEFANLGTFLPESHTEAFDRLTRIVQDLYRLAYTFGIHGPDQEDTAWTALPAASVRASNYLAFDSNGLPTLAALSSTTITGQIIANLLNLITATAPIASLIQTAAEIAASVTPTNYAYAPGDVRRYGVVGNNSTNDTVAFQAALNAAAVGGALAATGGAVVTVPPGAILYIAGNITIPANVTVKGPQSFAGAMTSNSMSAPYQTMGGQISLASTATITTNAGSCLDGLLIVQHGLTFPQAGPSNYAGTAITVAGDDVSLKNSMILGFNQAYSSSGFQRPHITHCLMDNNNGILISDASDVGLLFDIHMWPFGTFYSGVTASNIQRTGVAFNLQGGGSATGASVDCTECFCFGYNTGFETGGTGDDGNVFLKCWSDNTANAYGTGFDIVSGATDTKLLGCQASGNVQNYFFSNSSRLRTTLTDCNGWGATTHGLLCASGDAGDVIVRGGLWHNNPNCFTYAQTGGAGILDIDSVAVDSSNGVIYNITVSTIAVKIGQNVNYTNIAGGTQLTGNLTDFNVPSVASASTLNLPSTGNDFIVTGTTTIGSINFGYPGRQVTLYFSGICTVSNSTSGYSNARLSGGSSYTSTAGGTLTLRHNGVQWYEVGRAA